MKKILITGGPVHAFLDSVKIISNVFRGGIIAGMALDIAKEFEGGDNDGEDMGHVTYLCSRYAQQPFIDELIGSESSKVFTVLHHDGIDDYMGKVLQLAPQMDAVILGAAVANLIPLEKIAGKFPSHYYKEGDKISIDFTIAPRIIDRVKKVAPKTQLFGFKLLKGVEHDELISAAYGVLLESRATAIIANDATDLMQKFVVTKERAVHPMDNKDLIGWILKRLEEKYYCTQWSLQYSHIISDFNEVKEIAHLYRSNFYPNPEGLVFGSVAVRVGDAPHVPEGQSSFTITSRGKNELENFVFVEGVDHGKREVWVSMHENKGYKKASLNAPLLDMIFTNPRVHSIVHYHLIKKEYKTHAYATPGTTKDTCRVIATYGESFNIDKHGCYILLDREGNEL